MFCSTLRRRPSLSTLIPLLTSSADPRLQETNLQTHDLALPTQPQPSHTAQQQRPTTQPFLILTSSSLHDPNATERMNRFSTLTSSPVPTIVFLLSTSEQSDATGVHGFMELQTHLHPLPTPPPLLPIPSPHHLLAILRTYTTAPAPSPSPSPPPPPPAATLSLLPHVTATAPARPLSTHTTNVLSDLCRSVREVAVLAGTEGGRGVLGEWLGEEGGKGVAEFWEGEWMVEGF
ncbi:hypothetical protein HO173_008334 [Letharia columbiana]|uniref:Uncharacterized protein n=1 Tax=Letharia columbiana TaxID=112416 RepID=A0A8H6L2U0_9LECA|nr:uncharacterized protein HO173_008334 [Letharia columbiana]KAF6233402.1 hypothetical protein HO173_008334 [Letharia columbiana]